METMILLLKILCLDNFLREFSFMFSIREYMIIIDKIKNLGLFIPSLKTFVFAQCNIIPLLKNKIIKRISKYLQVRSNILIFIFFNEISI